MITSNILLNELYDYLYSSETARVYYYDKLGLHLNSKYFKCKIIKENCILVKKWLDEKDTAICAKSISLFVDGRRSLVPFHYMYKNKFNSTIFNEDCIFNKKFFKQTLSFFRTNKSYSCAFLILKPGAKITVPNAYCQPYVMCELYTIQGQGNIETDYYSSQLLSNSTSHKFYYRSNILIENKSEKNSIFFVNCNFMFNKFDCSDAWESHYATL